MSWGTSYTYEGYLSRVGKNELEQKREDLEKINPQNLYEYYLKLISTSKIDIFVSGELKKEEVTDIIINNINSLSYIPNINNGIKNTINIFFHL